MNGAVTMALKILTFGGYVAAWVFFFMIRKLHKRATATLADAQQVCDQAHALTDRLTAAMNDPKAVHEAMQDAPHDGQPYRQARAAIHAIAASLLKAVAS